MPAREGRRKALLMGVGQYDDPQLGGLRSPSADVAELAEVLQDSAIGGFDVQVLLDVPGHLLREEMDVFLADRQPDDLLVLYLSCHGITDLNGRLHYATSTTKLDRLTSTAISDSFIHELVDRCRARKILILLDCRYSRAYRKGHRPKAGEGADIRPFGGRGRVTITSSAAMEHQFQSQGDRIPGTVARSAFSSALIDGLRTGKADRNGDGLISADDLYLYICNQLRELAPGQMPVIVTMENRGDFILARNPRPTETALAGQSQQAIGAESVSRHGTFTGRRAVIGLIAGAAVGTAIAKFELAGPAQPQPTRQNSQRVPTKIWHHAFPAEPILLFFGLTVLKGVVVATTARQLLALRADTGKQVWKKPVDTIAAFAVSEDRIYSLSGTHDSSRVLALRADGRPIWSSDIEFTGEAIGPIVSSSIVCIANSDGKVYAFAQDTGRPLWRTLGFTGNAYFLGATQDMVYVADDVGPIGILCAMRIDGGKIAWTYHTGSARNENITMGHGMIYVIRETGSLHALRAASGKEVWVFSQESVLEVKPNASMLYVTGKNHLYALRPGDGKVIWRYSVRRASVQAVTASVIYLTDESNSIHAIEAAGGTLDWISESDNAITTITPAGSMLYVASNDLYGLSFSGVKLWTLPIEQALGTSPAVSSGILYIGSGSGIYAFRL